MPWEERNKPWEMREKETVKISFELSKEEAEKIKAILKERSILAYESLDGFFLHSGMLRVEHLAQSEANKMSQTEIKVDSDVYQKLSTMAKAENKSVDQMAAECVEEFDLRLWPKRVRK